MRALTYPLTPLPAPTATNVSLPLLPLAAAPPFLNAQKTALPVKVMVRLVCLPLCVSMTVGFCQMSRATPLHPSSLHLWPLFLSLSPKWSSLCMDCLHGSPGLTVTLTTVSITSVTHTVISSVSYCRTVFGLFPSFTGADAALQRLHNPTVFLRPVLVVHVCLLVGHSQVSCNRTVVVGTEHVWPSAVSR